MNKKTKQVIFFFVFIALTLLVGYFSSKLTGISMSSAYLDISNKPIFSPPAWIFAPVWTILYILMGISAFLVWKLKDQKDVKKPLIFFFIQLVLNFLWSIIFFGLGQHLWAFVEIVILLIMIIVTTVSFSKVSKVSAYLLIPYILWVSFASILNLVIALK
ncbi:MAG: TspO/MBR family protein [Candidatus Paceibacterota bacterium]|jgi:tryptophan-rich sensory protein